MSEVNLSQVAALEKQEADAKQLLERRQMALRLYTNRDFRKLILDGFCLNDAARYAQLSADPMLTKEQQTDSLNLAQASGHLKRFLSVTVQMGNGAEDELANLAEALAQARAEEGQG